ncbi:MAG: DUF6682 family protein [Pseudomonadota bacterium]
MTPQQVMEQAREILNDAGNVKPRFSDAKLLVFVNDWAKQLARLVPSVFYQAQELELAADEETQSVSRSTTLGVADVLRNLDGTRIRKVAPEQIEEYLRFYAPGSRVPELWAPVVGDPWRFLVFPLPPADTTIKLITVLNPPDVAVGVTLIPQDDYRASAANYVAARALMSNTSTADAGRAVGLLQMSASLAGMAGTS